MVYRKVVKTVISAWLRQSLMYIEFAEIGALITSHAARSHAT